MAQENNAIKEKIICPECWHEDVCHCEDYRLSPGLRAYARKMLQECRERFGSSVPKTDFNIPRRE